MLKGINSPSYKRKNKNEFPSDSKVRAKKSIPEDPGDGNLNSRMLTVTKSREQSSDLKSLDPLSNKQVVEPAKSANIKTNS